MPNIDLPVTAETDFYRSITRAACCLDVDLIAHELHDLEPSHRPRPCGGRFTGTTISGSRRLGRWADTAVQRAYAAVEPGAESGRARRQCAVGCVDRHRGGRTQRLWLVVAAAAGSARRSPPNPWLAGIGFSWSGLMGGLEKTGRCRRRCARGVAQMTYPFDLPDHRAVRMKLPRSVGSRYSTFRWWPSGFRRTPTSPAASLAEAAGHMLDNFVRDYFGRNWSRRC